MTTSHLQYRANRVARLPARGQGAGMLLIVHGKHHVQFDIRSRHHIAGVVHEPIIAFALRLALSSPLSRPQDRPADAAATNCLSDCDVVAMVASPEESADVPSMTMAGDGHIGRVPRFQTTITKGLTSPSSHELPLFLSLALFLSALTSMEPNASSCDVCACG